MLSEEEEEEEEDEDEDEGEEVSEWDLSKLLAEQLTVHLFKPTSRFH